MSSTKCTGIRIPTELYEIARAANPDKTFSEIVKCALGEKYSFTDSKNIADIQDIHSQVDRILGSVQDGVD